MAKNQTVSTTSENTNKTNSYVSLRHIDKIYDNNVQAVFDFNLEIQKKEFIVFVGPSGCGKSTTLRMIAGLEDISAGELWIDGVYSNDLLPRDRGIAMVFQSYALYPHMTVYDNMAFGLRVKKFPEEEISKRVHEAAKILEIEEYLDRKPKALSGGQRQRVALGRAIVRNAKVFLMDEPLSNLDAKLRIQMRSEIIKLHHGLNATTIYVTHDQTEAMTMASRIVVMKAGTIQQIGTPFEIYNNPSNLFVAGFIGSPPMNFLSLQYNKGIISLTNDQTIKLDKNISDVLNDFYIKEQKEYLIEFDKITAKLKALNIDLNSIDIAKDQIKKKPSLIKRIFKNKKDDKKETEEREIRDLKDRYLELKNDIDKLNLFVNGEGEIIFSIRPEDVHEVRDENASKINNKVEISLDVETAELLGHEYQIHSTFDGAEFVCTIPSTRPIATGDKIQVFLDLSKIHLFDKISTKRIY